MAPPISLTIVRQGDTNIIDLAEMGTLIPRSETRVSDAFLQEVNAEITSVATSRYSQEESRTVGHDLRRIGELLFSQLLPEAARQRLRTAEPCDLYLRLDERLVHIPWELGYDGEQFLVNKFRLGRQVITSAPVRGGSAARPERSLLRVLLIADPTETLPQAGEEAERLCHFFSAVPGVEVTLLGGRVVRKVPLLAALQSHDLVHFAGHSQYDPHTPSRSGWQLHEDLVTVGELGQLPHPPLLVFSNSCQAGATNAWGTSSHYDEQAFGIGSAFLLAGVKNYIGTFWVMHDEESARFATGFYQQIVSGLSLGEALQRARQQAITQQGWNSLTWASYMLYGDPALILLPSTTARPISNSSATEPPQRAQVMQRKLAAILSADVKGYSRLMGEDEVTTICTLTAYREVMTTLIQQHHGRVVDSPGDNLLAEFASAVDAVQGAVEIQQTLKSRNAELPPNRKMEFRIGINVGDVIVEAERLYGDGVNIAARLESLAEGGGICLSGTAYDQVKNKLALGYEYLGEQAVKNIAEPVRVYRLELGGPSPIGGEDQGEKIVREAESAKVQVPGAKAQERKAGSDRRKGPRRAVVGVVLITLALVAVRYLSYSSLLTPHSSLHTPEMLPLPDKPSIVVLPFTNMSGDPEQEYFSDGLTEDLTSALSRLSSLFIISRNSASTYKGKAVKVQEVSKEMGVQYVLEGSVRKADGQVRITAQLIDATQDHHLWTERYDRPLKDIFALQDEIVQKIVTTLKLQLSLWEQGVLVHRTTDNLEAYDTLLRGTEFSMRLQNETKKKEANEQARQMFERATELDPTYAAAYTALGWTYLNDRVYEWNIDPAKALDRAIELGQKAIVLDDSLPTPHSLLGASYLWKKQYDQAIAEAERAVALDPNFANGYVMLGGILALASRPEEGIELIKQAMRLNPHYPATYVFQLSLAYRLAGRYEEALAPGKSFLALNPHSWIGHFNLAVIYSELGQEAEARAEVLQAGPISLEWVRQNVPIKDPTVLERHLAALRRAGLK